MWKTAEPVNVASGCTVDSAYGDYHVCDPDGEIVGHVNPAYYQTRRDVIAVARQIITKWRDDRLNKAEGRS